MKKILFSLIALVASMSMNAQFMTIKKTENGETTTVQTFRGSKYFVVFEETAPATTGKAMRTGDSEPIEVNWVQLWEDGPKFAEYNVGAANDKAEDYGGYYGWGGSIDMSTTDYNRGSVNLTGNNDTATKLWGDKWRMPTSEELANLHHPDICTIAAETVNGVAGYRITGKTEGFTENSIFLPLGGFNNAGTISLKGTSGFYWSIEPYDNAAVCLRFHGGTEQVGTAARSQSLSVRAVLAE